MTEHLDVILEQSADEKSSSACFEDFKPNLKDHILESDGDDFEDTTIEEYVSDGKFFVSVVRDLSRYWSQMIATSLFELRVIFKYVSLPVVFLCLFFGAV